MRSLLCCVVVSLSVACGSSGTGGAGGGSGGSGGSGGGSGGAGGAQVVGGCPRVLLGSTLPAEFSGDTAGLPDIVTSPRLEWTDAPDDALEFTAPQAGDYLIELTSSNMSLGASAEDYNTNGSDSFPFTRTACPASGAVKEINGLYSHNQPTHFITLTQGQKMVIFVGAPYWAMQKTGTYTLKVSRKP